MSAGMVSLRYFVLGLLTQKPMSGYDIKRLHKSLSWLIRGPSFGSLYPTLRALREDGLVAVEVIPSQEKPPRKIYSVTEAGRQALRAWIDRPVTESVSLKTFVMRLLLAGNLSCDGLATHLRRRREQVGGYHAALGQIVKTMDEGTDLGQRLALDYGLALATTELRWLDSTLEQLSGAAAI